MHKAAPGRNQTVSRFSSGFHQLAQVSLLPIQRKGAKVAKASACCRRHSTKVGIAAEPFAHETASSANLYAFAFSRLCVELIRSHRFVSRGQLFPIQRKSVACINSRSNNSQCDEGSRSAIWRTAKHFGRFSELPVYALAEAGELARKRATKLVGRSARLVAARGATQSLCRDHQFAHATKAGMVGTLAACLPNRLRANSARSRRCFGATCCDGSIHTVGCAAISAAPLEDL